MQLKKCLKFCFKLWTQHDIGSYGSNSGKSRINQSPPPAHQQQASPITPVKHIKSKIMSSKIFFNLIFYKFFNNFFANLIFLFYFS